MRGPFAVPSNEGTCAIDHYRQFPGEFSARLAVVGGDDLGSNIIGQLSGETLRGQEVFAGCSGRIRGPSR
jgi:hypothetical protein